jgi:hypothetical protein
MLFFESMARTSDASAVIFHTGHPCPDEKRPASLRAALWVFFCLRQFDATHSHCNGNGNGNRNSNSNRNRNRNKLGFAAARSSLSIGSAIQGGLSTTAALAVAPLEKGAASAQQARGNAVAFASAVARRHLPAGALAAAEKSPAV